MPIGSLKPARRRGWRASLCAADRAIAFVLATLLAGAVHAQQAPAQDPQAEVGNDAAAATPEASTSPTGTEPPAQAAAAPAASPAVVAAAVLPLVDASLLLDITESDQRAIMVGERGHVLVSESRQDWRQVEAVPTHATLTAVDAAGASVWAVGHDQTILHSADGGLTWTLQRMQPFSEENLDDPRNGAPLLDMLALGPDAAIAVGAYALMLRTADGGATWTRVPLTGGGDADAAVDDSALDDAAPDDEGGADEADDSWTFSDEDLELDAVVDPHLNGIVRTGDGSLFVAAERGSAFRSTDDGASWERIQLPYEGSMFGAIGYDGRRLLTYGLRGNVFVTEDLGDTWTQLDTGTELSLQGGTAFGDSGAVLVGNNGVVLWRESFDAPFRQATVEDVGVLAAVLPVGGSRQLVVVGESGIGRFSAN